MPMYIVLDQIHLLSGMQSYTYLPHPKQMLDKLVPYPYSQD